MFLHLGIYKNLQCGPNESIIYMNATFKKKQKKQTMHLTNNSWIIVMVAYYFIKITSIKKFKYKI